MLSSIIKKNLSKFSKGGNLLTWGLTTYGWGRPINNNHWQPDYVEGFNDVKQVSTGQYHMGFVTSDKLVYTAGLSKNGRLGQEDSYDSQLPRRVPFDKSDVRVQKLSCGYSHNLAITITGEVYEWGSRSATFSEKNQVPTLINPSYFNNSKVVSVAAGHLFSMVLTEEGKVYYWGSSPHFIALNQSKTPTLYTDVQELCEKKHAKVIKIQTVDSYLMVLLNNGRIYSIGSNYSGVCATRKNPKIKLDLHLIGLTKIVDSMFKDEKIVDFESSSNSLIFVTDSGKIFYSGMYSKYQPTPFPKDIIPKKIFASQNSVGVISEDNKMYFLNEKIIDDSDFDSQKDKLYICEDERFEDVVSMSGNYALRCAIVN